MRFVWGMIAGLALVPVAALGLIYSGLYNVAATRPHTPFVNWALHTLSQRSIATQASAEVRAVPNLENEARIAAGARHYRDWCVTCHSGPGIEPSALGRGLMPRPPDLTATTHHKRTAAEQFWIVKHGVKMTGMPAWGPSTRSRDLGCGRVPTGAARYDAGAVQGVIAGSAQALSPGLAVNGAAAGCRAGQA